MTPLQKRITLLRRKGLRGQAIVRQLNAEGYRDARGKPLVRTDVDTAERERRRHRERENQVIRNVPDPATVGGI